MTVNALEMSDDEFLNTSFDSFKGESDDSSSEQTEEETVVEETVTEETESDDDVEELNESTDEDAGDSSEAPEEEEKEIVSEEIEETKEETIKPKADEELAKLFAPFKANGKDIKINSVDEAIQLMQMGANYNKKMAALKPVLKVARMLENNGLMDENQVSFAIDLIQKKPEAIAKLLKDNEIDPLNIDLDRSSDYKDGTHIVNEAQLKVEEVLEQIKETPTYNRTINVVTKEWDDSSRQILATNPEIIVDINSHIESGIYDMIQSEMERQRLFGGLKGLSDIQAYKAVGDTLNAQGKFDQVSANSEKTPEVKPKTSSKPDPKTIAKKQAAAITKDSKPAQKNDSNFNPLAMSDEEFEKQFGNKL